MKVPVLRIPFTDDDRAFMRAGIDEILNSGMLTQGKHTERFEQLFRELTGARYSIAVSNATAGLEIILRALEVEEKSVIVPTNTFMATAFAVIHSGNRVIFADSDPRTLCLDVEDVRRRIAPDTRAVILVHVGGVITPAVHDLKRLCDERGLHFIEDCAHAHGCTLAGQQAGTFGVAGAFSFFPTKVLTTGEGGMITTDDEGLYRRALMIRNHGKNPACGNRMSEMGHNHRLSEFTALVGVQQLARAHTIIDERRRVARFYDKSLRGMAGARPLELPEDLQSSYYKYPVYLDETIDRSRLKRVLKEQYGVSLTGEVYADLCHTEPVWQTHTCCGRRRTNGATPCLHGSACNGTASAADFPGAEYISRHHVCLPLYPDLDEAELTHVVESLERALSESGGD